MNAPDFSIDLWKFFEKGGAQLNDSMFSVVTLIIGLASAVLGFAVKESFVEHSALTSITHPPTVIGLSLAGLIVLAFANLVIRDYGRLINRTYERADAARKGETSREVIWVSGQKADPTAAACLQTPTGCACLVYRKFWNTHHASAIRPSTGERIVGIAAVFAA
jgi:hypothetical protein